MKLLKTHRVLLHPCLEFRPTLHVIHRIFRIWRDAANHAGYHKGDTKQLPPSSLAIPVRQRGLKISPIFLRQDNESSHGPTDVGVITLVRRQCPFVPLSVPYNAAPTCALSCVWTKVKLGDFCALLKPLVFVLFSPHLACLYGILIDLKRLLEGCARD